MDKLNDLYKIHSLCSYSSYIGGIEVEIGTKEGFGLIQHMKCGSKEKHGKATVIPEGTAAFPCFTIPKS